MSLPCSTLFSSLIKIRLFTKEYNLTQSISPASLLQNHSPAHASLTTYHSWDHHTCCSIYLWHIGKTLYLLQNQLFTQPSGFNSRISSSEISSAPAVGVYCILYVPNHGTLLLCHPQSRDHLCLYSWFVQCPVHRRWTVSFCWMNKWP